MIKTKRQMFIVIACFTLILLLGTTTYAFFNYTRTGSSNTIKVGRIAFNSEQGSAINLTNVFPIDVSNGIPNDSNVGSVTIHITGDTTYNEGVEYLVSAVNVQNTVNDKQVPISIDVSYANTNNKVIGTEDADYFTNRGGDSSIYKVLANETIKTNDQLVVGYVASGNTGIDGNIVIRAYLDASKIAISDTYDGNETDNMGTATNWVNDRVVFTTSEWNSLQTNGISFQVKVEANEGIWVEKPSAFNIIKKNVNTSMQINFANNSSDTNGKGLYILPGTESDTNPIYYFRGAINNNNVLFGGYCWQMVRTTDTGGIKMIYNGEPTITGSGSNMFYNCGTTRDVQNYRQTLTSLTQSTGYYYADDFEVVSTTGNSAIYRLKSKSNPITQVAIANAEDASTKIPIIVANYPYTCMQTTDTGTCRVLYRVDSYSRETYANLYGSHYNTIIDRSLFRYFYSSISDAGYMSNTRYNYYSSGWTTNALFASSATWVTDHYELTDASVTTPNETHHYSCNTTTAEETCTSLRYVYYVNGTTKYYISLTNGELIEDALYKMTGTGSFETKQKYSDYILNKNDSNIKSVIDTWFEANLTNEVDNTKIDYRIYLEDTAFCNDRSFKTAAGSASTYLESGWNPNGGNLKKYLYFGSVNRTSNNWYSTTNVPTTACPNESDRFTVSSSNGNGALKYPVGLLTVDEIVMAGASGEEGRQNTTYYLYTGAYYWSMSPVYYIHNGGYDGSYLFDVTSDGYLNVGYANSSAGVRPVVSLKSGIEFESGGDGTPTNPYVVKYN